MKVFYTFGSDERFPFCGGWVEVEAPQHEGGARNIPGALPGQNTGDAELLRLLHGGPVQRVRHAEYRQPRGVLPPQAQRIAETLHVLECLLEPAHQH